MFSGAGAAGTAIFHLLRAMGLGDAVICDRKGVMSAGSSCRSFKYDPLKRVPPRPAKADFSRLKDEDFVL